MANLFHKAAVQVGDLPTVTKTHDDLFLRPANTRIGERPCINDDRCLAKFLAQVRFGADSPKAFTCTEFLLPDVHKRFLDGRGLPPRRSKCILCYRYFTTFVYTAARADPSFRAIEASGLGVQAFQNSICPPADAAPADDLAQLERDVGTGPSHASALNCQDGYAAHAALFVDEAFSQQRAGREDKLGALAFRPQVRFDSSHYRYVLDAGGPRIEQVGIGAQDTLALRAAFSAAGSAVAPGAVGGRGAPALNPHSSLRHRYTSFDDAGLPEALRRGWALLGDDVRAVDLAFWARDFDQLTFEVTGGRVESGVLYTAVTACRAAERRHRAALAAALDAEGASHVASQWRPDPALEARLFDAVPALCDWSAFGVGPETRMAIATVRLALGAAVEAALARASVAECWTMAKPGKAVPLGKSKLGGEAWARTPDGKRQLKAARLYNDAALVAAWTSAHAAFVEDCQAGLLEPPSPSIFSVLNSFTEYNFADLLARRVVLKDKSIAKALPLLTLLIKAMNTSARGWETLLEQTVPKSTCLRTIVGRALAVSCSGLHECVHPALRAPWPRRHAAGKRVFLQTSGERLPALVAGATTAAREAVRRLVVTTVACMPATARARARRPPDAHAQRAAALRARARRRGVRRVLRRGDGGAPRPPRHRAQRRAHRRL